MTFGLRAGTPADIDFIRSLTTRSDYTPFIGDSDEAAIRGWIDSPAAAVMIAVDGDQPVGFAIFREIGDPSGRVELFRIALDKAGGGRGDAFFNALLDHGFQHLAAQRIWLDASGENPRAIKIYTRAGCVVEGIQRQHWFRPCLRRAVDLHLMAMMRDEWAALRQAAGA